MSSVLNCNLDSCYLFWRLQNLCIARNKVIKNIFVFESFSAKQNIAFYEMHESANQQAAFQSGESSAAEKRRQQLLFPFFY